MTYFIVDSSLSIAKKQLTFHVKIFTFLGTLKDEFSIRCFGKNAFDGDSKTAAKLVMNEIYPNKENWQTTTKENVYKIQLENGNNCLIYPPNKIPKGGRKKGSKDSYKRTRTNKKVEPQQEVIETIIQTPEETIDENNEVLETAIQS